jgi:hypothetical protein
LKYIKPISILELTLRKIMSTLPPPSTKKFPEDSLESRVYKIVEELKEYLPVSNDRNRLGVSLYFYMKGEGDKPEVLVNSMKLKIQKVSPKELAEKINTELAKIKQM